MCNLYISSIYFNKAIFKKEKILFLNASKVAFQPTQNRPLPA